MPTAHGPAVRRGALDGDDDLIVMPLLQRVPSVIPDRDRTGTVLTVGDGALERAVVHRVVLSHHGKVVVAGRGRHALGEAQLTSTPPCSSWNSQSVHAAGVVLLDI